eukprot:scaffold4822_cov60-Phaeocystis_antarctica.AAC.3
MAICNQVALGRPQRRFIVRIYLNGSVGARRQLVVKTAREEVARNAVEVIEVAEASLDHGEQMLAIALQKALRLASIEGSPLCVIRWISTRSWSPPTGRRTRATIERRVRGAVHQVRGPSHDEQRLAAREEDGQAGERLLGVTLVDARLVLCGARRGACIYEPSVHAVGRVRRLGGRHQPECRLLTGLLLAPLRPARHDRVLGAGRLLLVTPRVAQKGGHLPHRRWLRARVQRRPCWWRSRTVGEVRGLQPAGGQAPEELRGAFERGVGVAAADERRDRRRLFRLGAAPAQTSQAAVGAATVAGRGEGGEQEAGNTHDRSCPVYDVVVSLDVVCDAACAEDHAETQEEEAVHGPQPPQGGAGLHGAITAAAQRGDDRAGGDEVQRSKRESKRIWRASG